MNTIAYLMRFLLFLINIKVCFLATANNDYFLVIKSPNINSLFYEVHKFPHKLYIHFYYCKIKTWGKYISRWHFEGYTSFKICEGHLNSSLESKLIPSIATGKGIEETWFWNIFLVLWGDEIRSGDQIQSIAIFFFYWRTLLECNLYKI